MTRTTRTLGAMALLVTTMTGCADVGTKTMVGGLGGAAGNYLDQRDRQLAAKAAQSALETAPSGTTTAWKNPDNGNSGAVTPKRTYQTASGQYCREYTQTINVGGKKQTSYGTACRQPDGQWKIVS